MQRGGANSGPARIALSDEQRLSWLQLIRSENVGPATFRDLVNHFGSATAALEALPELAKRGGVAARVRIATRECAETEMQAAARIGARFIGLGESAYPPLLRGLDHPPPLVCVRGKLDVKGRVLTAIVGSRNASIAGMKLAARFAAELGANGHIIVSGLARGIDSSAHKASLRSGTIAVLAGGIDCPFPESHTNLAEEIVENGGALVSEMPLGWKPRNIDFPRRNRIIAGLSLGVLVVEAAKRSGSLITARLANENGRFVFAAPGSPLDPRAAGTNQLIKQGATLVTEAKDILETYAPIGGGEPQLPFEAGEEEGDGNPDSGPPVTDADESVRLTIISALGPSPVEVDDVVRYSGASTGEVQLVLLELDLAGRLVRHAGGRISLKC